MKKGELSINILFPVLNERLRLQNGINKAMEYLRGNVDIPYSLTILDNGSEDETPEIGKALRDIGYQKAVVMEPFLLSGGQVGRDIRVWRDLSGGADEAQMTKYITDSLAYLKKCCEG